MTTGTHTPGNGTSRTVSGGSTAEEGDIGRCVRSAMKDEMIFTKEVGTGKGRNTGDMATSINEKVA
jgi:hypothetical protein